MISLKNTLNAIATSISAGTNYIIIHGIGICWGYIDQSYAVAGEIRTRVNFPIVYSSAPAGFVSTTDCMRGFASGTPNGYGIITYTTCADVGVWVNRTYSDGTSRLFWLVIGNV